MRIKTLTHKGVLFPDPFESKGFDNIDGIRISLFAEEMLWKYSPYCFNRFKDDKVFISNVWIDLRPYLPKELQSREFPKDFMPTLIAMKDKAEKFKIEKAEYNKTHKEEIEKKRNDRKEKYGYCVKNGVRTEIANFVTEGSRWFVSRGDLRGRWVSSVCAEDVELNSSEDIPCTQEGHSWGKIHLRQTDYIATYKINVGFGTAYIDKFIWLSANSKDKQKDNEFKYEKARKLFLKIDDIENKVLKDVCSKNKLRKENALITYVILTYGIRIGNDLGADNIRDKNVRGASTLCVENMVLEEGNKIHLEFIGKDSVPYSETMIVNPVVYEQFAKQIKNKSQSDKIYDFATSVTVNNYLKSIYKGKISPKLFRTAKSSALLADEIRKREWKNLTDKEFKNNLMECCLQASLLLNHHKTVNNEQKEKVNSSTKNKIESAKNSFEKTKRLLNEKLKRLQKDKKDYKDCLSGKFLDSKLVEIKEKEKELKSKLILAEKKYSDVLREVEFKRNSVDVNLNTAIANYIDPRLIMSLCNYSDKNKKIVYSSASLKKFSWCENESSAFWKKAYCK